MCSAVILTIIRALLVLAVGRLALLSGVQLGLGIVLFALAIRTATIDSPQNRITGRHPKMLNTSLLKLLGLVMITDFAVSFDNLVAIVAVTTHVAAVAIGVFFSIVPLLLLLPVITKVFTEMPWVQIIASGVMTQTAVKAMMKDPFIRDRLPAHSVNPAHVSLIAAVLFVAIEFAMYIRKIRATRK
ncbi:TerC family protein [Alicyclobacillus acidiphilus]|uniref:TerC family protein n=1 Tax=Alicyclobacillus acidiphilus TaxID=182455 RepID=UPI000833CEE3|nr:hypothetical protein [Alicyclobacillus acidiphilus]